MNLRRSFLALTLALGLTAAANDDAPKYIFYFIADGMGHGHVMAADTYRRLVEKQQDKLLMLQFPWGGSATTYSANTPVTDSAAAGTALATGRKTKNSMLGMAPDSTVVENLGEQLHALGYGIGLVTNVCPDDATPAAFYAHVVNRNQWDDVAMQFAKSPVKFLAGAKLRGAMRGNRYTGLYERMEAEGVSIVRGTANLPQAETDRVVLLNTDTVSKQLGFAIDGHPGHTLGEFTAAAIAHMERTSPERFFIMIEGGNIDWAGHDNDGPTIVREVLDFDGDALRRAYDFYLAHPDETLIVVTADHETGGMTVGQLSTLYNHYPQVVDRQHRSKTEFANDCFAIARAGKPFTWEQMRAKLAADLGFFTESKLSASQEKRLREAFDRTFVTRDGTITENLYASYPEFAETVYTIQNELAGYGFTSPKHTGNPVPIFAIGVGAHRFARHLDNTEIPRLIRALAE